MKKNILILTFWVLMTPMMFSCNKTGKKLIIPSKPNIVIIYMDDLGYGDIGVHGAKGVKTPNIDKLAQDGVDFTDAHCAASTCTPSRFSLLTGIYAFRRNARVLSGKAPLLINTHKGTIASMLHRAGYKSAVIGKWHLGLGNGNVNWNKSIAPGPLEVGFNYSLIIPATPDRVPTVLVKNHRVWHLHPQKDSLYISYRHSFKGGYPPGKNHESQLNMMADNQHLGSVINGVSRIGFEKGGKSAMWNEKKFASEFTQQAIAFMKRNKNHPFFLYFASQDIHVPRIPAPRFRGKSTMGRRGDAIAEGDWEVGQLINAIKKMGLSKNTLIIFSSDNGPILGDGYGDQANYLLNGDKPWGPYKGGKYSAFEAGTRVPLIVDWPGIVKHKVSHALISQVDLYASLAYLTGQKVRSGSASDSFNMLRTFLGKSNRGRKYLVEQSPFTLSLRNGKWQYISPITGSVWAWGWLKSKKHDPKGLADTVQLYNLKKDIRENNNVAPKYPKLVNKLKRKLEQIHKTPVRKQVMLQQQGGQ